MARTIFRVWNYNDVKHVLDRVGSQKFPHHEPIKDLSVELNRSPQAIWAMHYMWETYLGNTKSHTNPSRRLKALFDAYRSVNGTAKVAEAPKESTSTDVEKALTQLEEQFEALRKDIADVIAVAVAEQTSDKLHEHNKEFIAMQAELEDLRKFKENVKTTSVFMQLRRKLSGS